MNELLSMVVPLETLSGWPQVPSPSVWVALAIFVGFPLAVFIIVIAIDKIARSIHASRGQDIHATDPLWVGDHEAAELEAAGANPGAAADGQVAAEAAGELDSQVEGDDTGEHVGGAGARW